MNRLKQKYQEQILPTLVSEFALTSVMAAPKIVKVVINTGIKEGASDRGAVEKAAAWMAAICGQAPSKRKAKKSIATFKIREGDVIGLSTNLRGDRMYEFLDKLMSIVLPRVRDFKGVNKKSFDGRGNYTLGISEQIIFPEVDYSKIDKIRGLEITIVTSSGDDTMTYRMLELMGMPFSK